jgi:hypothetical protein
MPRRQGAGLDNKRESDPAAAESLEVKPLGMLI